MSETRVVLNPSYTGRTLARDVYRDRNTLLLSKGHVLTDAVIQKMKKNGVIFVYLVSSENS